MVKRSVFDGVVGESTLGIAQVKSNCYSVNYGLAELEFSMANHRFCNVATPPIALEEVPVIRCMGLNSCDNAVHNQ